MSHPGEQTLKPLRLRGVIGKSLDGHPGGRNYGNYKYKGKSLRIYGGLGLTCGETREG